MAEHKFPEFIHPSCHCAPEHRAEASHANLAISTVLVDQMRATAIVNGLCNYDVIMILCGALHSWALRTMPVNDEVNKEHAFAEIDVATKKYREDYDTIMAIPEELRMPSEGSAN